MSASACTGNCEGIFLILVMPFGPFVLTYHVMLSSPLCVAVAAAAAAAAAHILRWFYS